MDLYVKEIISLLVIIFGIICAFYGVQIIHASKGKFKIVTILFGVVVVLGIIKEFVSLTTIDTNIVFFDYTSGILSLFMMIAILSAVLLMRNIINEIHNGYSKSKSKREKKNIKPDKVLNAYQQKIKKPIQKKKDSYINKEGYLVIKKNSK